MKNILKLRFWFCLIVSLGSGYAVSLGVDALLRPRPKYELRFESGTAKSCRVANNRLWIERLDPKPRVINGFYAPRYHLYSLETGRYVSELDWSAVPTPSGKALPLPRSLPVDPDRYVLSTDSRGRTALVDLVTEQWYQFHGFEPNEDALNGSYSIESFTADVLLSTMRLPLQVLFPPLHFGGLATPLLWTSQQSSLYIRQSMPLLMRLLRVPDKREMGRVLLGPGIRHVSAGYSPSLKHLIMRASTASRFTSKSGEDSHHATPTPMLWDLAQSSWQAATAECMQCNTATSWFQGWTHADGKYLVKTNHNTPTNSLLGVEVYELPLPVWSRWWPRCAAILTFIIFWFLFRKIAFKPRKIVNPG